MTLTFDLWPWPFAWTSLLSLVITPENFMMIRWSEHSQKGVTDRQTDGRTDRQTDWTIHRAAWSQLKIPIKKNTFQHIISEMSPILLRFQCDNRKNLHIQLLVWIIINQIASFDTVSMGSCKKEVTPVLAHWSYIFLAWIHRYRYITGNMNTVIPYFVDMCSLWINVIYLPILFRIALLVLLWS